MNQELICRSRANRHGFTLIELLVVIAIIAILAAILFPVFAQAKIAAKKTQLISNMKNLGTGAQLYVDSNDGQFPEMVQGGCTGRATAVNSLWTRQIYPYVKNKDVFIDPMANLKHAGFRFDSSVVISDVPTTANPSPCGDTNTDRRAQSIGLNRAFFSYFQCDPTAQIGCSNVAWDPGTDAGCAAQMVSESRIQETSNFVLLANTTVVCAAGSQGYAAGSPPALNTIDGMSSRAGEGTVIGFADSHAKYYPARQDSQISAALGANGAAARVSPVQNRKAVLLRAQGQGNAANGVLNCVNHNSAGVTWSPWTARKGENTALDTLCGQ